MPENFGDFQLGVYADAVKGVNSRFPFDARSIERKAAEALPDWVYRYVSAAAGDGRTQQANIDAYSHYGIIPRMMVSPPQRDLSIDLFDNRLNSPIFMCPIGLIGLWARPRYLQARAVVRIAVGRSARLGFGHGRLAAKPI